MNPDDKHIHGNIEKNQPEVNSTLFSIEFEGKN